MLYICLNSSKGYTIIHLKLQYNYTIPEEKVKSLKLQYNYTIPEEKVKSWKNPVFLLSIRLGTFLKSQ